MFGTLMSKKSDIAVWIVIALLILIVILQYAAYHSKANNGSPMSLSEYLSGLAQQVAEKSNPVASASTTPSAVLTIPVQAAAAPAASVYYAKPFISGLTPTTGQSGLTIILYGRNFDPSLNYVTFGPTDGLHGLNGLPDNIVAESASSNGKTLTFNVPLYAPNGLLCDPSGKNCTNVDPVVLTAGAYAVTVTSRGGASNTVWFTLTR